MIPDDKTRPPGRAGPGKTSAGREASLSEAAIGDIARGPAGDCCILCGKVEINLPLDHGCKPNIDVEAYRAQLLVEKRQGWWDR